MSMTRVTPDGLPAAALLSLLATAGLFYVNIMAALVSGLSDGLGFSPQAAGAVVSANVYGAAAGAFVATMIVRRVRWRIAAAILLVALIAIDLLSCGLRTAPLLIAARAAHGLVGGMLVGVMFSVIGRTQSPDRVFGVLLIVQFGFGGVGLWLLPGLVPIYGASSLFLALAAFSATALALLPLLPAFAVEARDEAVTAPRLPWTKLAPGLIAIFLFQAANMAVAAFVIEIGRAGGLSLSVITPILGVANWVGSTGSLVVVLVATRWGRRRPILIGTVLTALVTLLFLRASSVPVFVAANMISSVLWAFVIPYLLGLASAFDRTGLAATYAGLFSKLGLASGPLIAGFLIQAHDQVLLIVAAAVLIVAAGLFAGAAARAAPDQI